MVQAVPDETPQVDKSAERGAALRKAYGIANTRLREARRDEFEELYKEAAAELGVEYTPRLTPEQKAEQEFSALLAEFPHLASKVGQV